jgi:hypothetical protein
VDTFGLLWWDSNSGQLFVQYDDGTSVQWVSASSIDASTLEGSFLPLTGGTVTGPIGFGVAGTERWRLQTNASDNLELYAYGASGAFNGSQLTIWNDGSGIGVHAPLVLNTSSAISGANAILGLNHTTFQTGAGPSQGAKFSYFSAGASNGFDTGITSVAIFDPVFIAGQTPFYEGLWIVSESPNDTTHNWSCIIGELNIVNRGLDKGWMRDRTTANPTGGLLFVPAVDTFGGSGGGEGKNATFALSVTHCSVANSTGTKPAFYNGLLIEPNGIVGQTGRAIYMTGDITGTAALYPYGPMQLDGTWLHGIDHTLAVYADGNADVMAKGQALAWISGTTTAPTAKASITGMANGDLDYVTPSGSAHTFRSGVNLNATIAGGIVTGVNAIQTGDTSGPTWTTGSDVPSSIQPAGSLYSRNPGAGGARLYVSIGGGVWNAVAGV